MRQRTAGFTALLLVVVLCTSAVPASASASAPWTGANVASGSIASSAADDGLPSWEWPVSGPRVVVEPFRAPAHRYGPGHRGIDISAPTGTAVTAPADGVVAFRGSVAGRPLITIDHGAGLVSTFEPLTSSLSPGDAVSAGDEVGLVDRGGHTPPGAVHLGVRLDGEYINPMLLFGEVPRAVLLPCCAPL